MFSEGYTYFKLLDVYRIKRKQSNVHCDARPWAGLGFRISGESVFYSNGKKIIAGSGSLLHIPEGTSFSRKSTSEELIIIHIKCFENEDKDIEVLKQVNFSVTLSWFEDIYKEWEEKKAGYEHRCTAMLHMLLAKIKNDYISLLTPSKYRLIQPGVDFIDSNFDNPEISIDAVSKMCNISAEYFRKLYRDAYGTSPRKAIMEKRIQKACKLLQSGYFTIGEAADLSGFSDRKYFSTLFRSMTNMTPKEYADNHSKNLLGNI